MYGIHNGRVIIREPGLTDDQLIDVLYGNRVYIPSLIVLKQNRSCKPRFCKRGSIKDWK